MLITRCKNSKKIHLFKEEDSMSICNSVPFSQIELELTANEVEESQLCATCSKKYKVKNTLPYEPIYIPAKWLCAVCGNKHKSKELAKKCNHHQIRIL